MTKKIITIGKTHVGKKRTNNEDNYYSTAIGEHGFLFLVADGVGGRQCGEVASATIVEVITALAEPGKLEALEQESMCEMMLTMAVQKAHVTIAKKAQENPEMDGMSSTLTIAYANHESVWVAQVGDSRLYLHSNNTLQQLTRDQTIAEALLDAGRIAQEQVSQHPDRNTLQQSMGLEAVGQPLAAVVTQHPWKAGDVLLACSDGLTDMANDQLIEQILSANTHNKLEETAGKLIDAALDGGGKDNITVVLAENT